jgi:SAM-dependent methyltransferase
VAWGNYESNLEFLRRAGLTTAATRVLEIGCGKGAILGYLQKAGHVVAGVDVDASALAYCVAPARAAAGFSCIRGQSALCGPLF